MFASHAPTSGDAGCPRRAPAGRRPVGRGYQTSGALVRPPPPASSRSGNISCPRPHPQLPGGSELASQPGQRSQLPQLASQPTLAGEVSVWLRKTKGEPRRREPSQVVRNPRVRARQGPTGDAPGPRCLSLPARLRGCPGAAGLSRRCLPTQLPMLASQPVPMHRRRRMAGYSTLLPRTAASPGQRLPQPDIGSSWDLPWGARCPTPASPQTLRARGEGGGQARGARDSPGQRPAGWRGGGRGRTPPQLLRARSRLPAGAGPPEPVSHLPNPAPAQPCSRPLARDARASAAGRPRCACDLTAPPLGPGLVFSLASP